MQYKILTWVLIKQIKQRPILDGTFRPADAESLLYVATLTCAKKVGKLTSSSSRSPLSTMGEFVAESYKLLWISMLWYYQSHVNNTADQTKVRTMHRLYL